MVPFDFFPRTVGGSGAGGGHIASFEPSTDIMNLPGAFGSSTLS